MTETAKLNLVVETDLKVSEVETLADVVHSVRNISASLASGSFRTEG
jgi:4-hydroxy-3-polyprenylbenzoate decarboxylase